MRRTFNISNFSSPLSHQLTALITFSPKNVGPGHTFSEALHGRRDHNEFDPHAGRLQPIAGEAVAEKRSGSEAFRRMFASVPVDVAVSAEIQAK